MMYTRTIAIQTEFDAEPERFFALLTQLSTLQYIARPLAYFAPVDGAGELCWEPDQTFCFRLRIFGVLPMGVHTIWVEEFVPESILTHESNPFVPVWNHRIRLAVTTRGTLAYTDEVEIGAGWKTPFVALWAKAFYRHRQRRWRRLLK